MAPGFYILLLITFIIYYLSPKSIRWVVLLISSCVFYFLACSKIPLLMLFLLTLVSTYCFSLLIEKQRRESAKTSEKRRRATLALGIFIPAVILLSSKGFEQIGILKDIRSTYLLPLGLSFYTLQIIAYLVDIYKGKTDAQKNFFKYALFISFFPQIIQGPIPRYSQLSDQLFDGHDYDDDRVMAGINLVIWGFFLKYMIADKAGVIVDTIDASPQTYRGFYVVLCSVMYSFHLYADFLSCVTISRGVARLFGIELTDNFRQPFFSTSVKELWGRWHVTLGTWLRDYIYIPLGGSRKGKVRRYINLFITFFISALWHGMSLNFIVWGLLQAVFQIIEDASGKFSQPFYRFTYRVIRRLYVFAVFCFTFTFFRMPGFKEALSDIGSVFTMPNPWIFFDGSIFRLGLNEREFGVLVFSLILLLAVSIVKEKNISIRKWFFAQSIPVKWAIYLVLIWSIWIFGTYGYGFDSASFIYGGF